MIGKLAALAPNETPTGLSISALGAIGSLLKQSPRLKDRCIGHHPARRDEEARVFLGEIRKQVVGRGGKERRLQCHAGFAEGIAQAAA